jgi:putative phosphoesterase
MPEVSPGVIFPEVVIVAMRIGVISDSHGLLYYVQRAVEDMGQVDLLLHAGDHYRDASQITVPASVPIHAVVGNCDSRNDGPGEKLLEIEGVSLLLTHGHLYQVHMGISKILYRAAKLNAAVAVFGHTHVAGYQWHGGTLLFNPGSITSPRDGKGVAYGILEINDGKVIPKIVRM